jgi:hypothetical protein
MTEESQTVKASYRVLVGENNRKNGRAERSRNISDE